MLLYPGPQVFFAHPALVPPACGAGAPLCGLPVGAFMQPAQAGVASHPSAAPAAPAGFQLACCAAPPAPGADPAQAVRAPAPPGGAPGQASPKAEVVEPASQTKAGENSGQTQSTRPSLRRVQSDKTPSASAPTQQGSKGGKSGGRSAPASSRKARGQRAAPAGAREAAGGADAGGGDAGGLGQDKERCDQIIAEIEAQGSSARPMLTWLLPVTKELAFTLYGCRVVQKAIEATGAEIQGLIVEELKGSVIELYKSPHGNHVVAKMIEVMPPANLDFLIRELMGTVTAVARHQYGCRLLERLIEHCPAAQVRGAVEEVLAEAEPLCRHPYGNFVMQHLFEHGLQSWKASIAAQIIGTLPFLAKHRTASHVVQKALQFGGDDIQLALVSALLGAEGEDSLVEVGCTRYGSFVVEELLGIPACSDAVRRKLEAGLPRLDESHYGKRAVAKFGGLRAAVAA